MKSILEVLKLSEEYLKAKGIKGSRRQAEEVLSDALNMKRLELYMQFDKPLNDAELTICRERIKRRGKGEPFPYINGFVEFYDCKIKVNPDVLIPRPETEILVDKIVKKLSDLSFDSKNKVLWDVCCGSGCIGLALKKQFPDLKVVLSDVSPLALKVAQENAQLNDLSVTFVQGDLLNPFKGQKADIIVCNPPYISEVEYEQLDPEVRNFEPKLALVGGEQGNEMYRRLAKQLKEFLNPGGIVCFEIGYLQGPALLELFSAGQWQQYKIEKDYAGHDRFFFLENE